jgi:hypothetical protein
MPSRFTLQSDTYTVYNSDNKTIVKLHKGGYYPYLAAPGKVKLWAFAVADWVCGYDYMRRQSCHKIPDVAIEFKCETTLDLSPGDVKYVKATEESYAGVHRINLTVIDPSAGETEIKECTLIQDEH